jgi:hypothetical protein
MNTESMKEMLLDIFKRFQSLDVSATPTYYFTKELYKNLTSLGNRYAEMIVENVVVDLSGLGTDYEPNKEYLDKLAYVSAVSINQIWIAGKKISEGYAIKLMKGVSITLTP